MSSPPLSSTYDTPPLSSLLRAFARCRVVVVERELEATLELADAGSGDVRAIEQMAA